jgi:hypothetical protein
MAIRFTASNQRMILTANAGNRSRLSVCGWYKLMVDRNTFSTLWSFSNTADTNFLDLVTSENGTSVFIGDEGTASISVTGSLSVGVWTYIGIAVNGTSTTWRWRTISAPTFTSYTRNVGTSTHNCDRFTIADIFPGSSDYFNGSYAAIKVWLDTTLTTNQLEQEYEQFDPVNTDGLYAYYRFATNSGVDSSGNNRHLSGGSGTTADSDPPGIPERLAPKTVIRGWGPIPIF